MIDLSKQVGELAKQVMIKEKYYAWTNDDSSVDEQLGNEMADVIAQVMRLADFMTLIWRRHLLQQVRIEKTHII